MAYPNMQLSNKVAKIPEALSIYINQLVYDQQRRGKDITVLSLGEAFFNIPMFDFNELDFARCYHYSDSRGIPELRDKISYFYKKHDSPKARILVSKIRDIKYIIVDTEADTL